VRERIQSSYGAVEIQITPPRSATPGNVGLEALIKIPRKHTVDERIRDLEAIDHVVFALAGN
jgi:hypothetical protein